MKKVVFATGNQSKGKRFSNGLMEKGIEVVTIKDLQIELNVIEDGKDAIQNALIKARTCFEKTHMPTIGMDDTLYLENVPKEKQPGLYVRRINGKTLNDDEMIKHYTDLVRIYGIDGKLNSKWIYGLAVINENGEEFTYTWTKDNFYMVEKLSKTINPGYPLNTISKYKKIDKYFTDVTEEDMKFVNISEDDVVNFIASHI